MDVSNLTQSLSATLTSHYSLASAYSDSIAKSQNNEVSLTLGDNLNILHKITKRGKTFSIPSSATVTSRILSLDRSVAYTSGIAQVSTQKYANWDRSCINVQMSEDTTDDIALANPVWVRGRIPAILETRIVTDTTEIFFASIMIYLDIG